MTHAIRVNVTAEHIAAAGRVPDIGDGFKSSHPEGKDPVELAIADAAGESVICDQDEDLEMATIGQGANTLVVTLPAGQMAWIDRWYRGQPVEPFSFDFELEDWLVALVAKASA